MNFFCHPQRNYDFVVIWIYITLKITLRIYSMTWTAESQKAINRMRKPRKKVKMHWWHMTFSHWRIAITIFHYRSTVVLRFLQDWIDPRLRARAWWRAIFGTSWENLHVHENPTWTWEIHGLRCAAVCRFVPVHPHIPADTIPVGFVGCDLASDSDLPGIAKTRSAFFGSGWNMRFTQGIHMDHRFRHTHHSDRHQSHVPHHQESIGD